MMRGIAVVITIALACHRPAGDPGYPLFDELGTTHVEPTGPEPTDVATLAPEAEQRALRRRMRQQLHDLRRIEDRLVEARLDEARTLAFLLTRGALTPELAAWPRDTAEIATHAHALARASRLDEALRIDAQLSAVCAGCHARVGARLRFEGAPPLPAGPEDRCSSRQRWAIDRMREGLLAGSDAPWRAGLDVLATTRLTTPVAGAGHQLRTLAREQRDGLPRSTASERASAYGAMLTTCSGCHAATPRVRGRR